MSDYIAMSIDMLQRAFPERPTDREYLALMRIMGPHMSQRNLAEVLVIFTGRDDARVANDVLGIDGMVLDEREVERVQRLLDGAGFDVWLRDA
jgi:hypothetical protein